MTVAREGTTAASQRPSPHDESAERALIGSVLTSPEALAAVADVAADDFHQPAYGHVLDAVRAIAARGERHNDAVVVIDELRRRGMLDFVGGPGEVVALAGDGGTATASYARIVVDLARLRRIIGTATELREAAYQGRDRTGDLVPLLMATATADARATRSRLGGSFVLDVDPSARALWGSGDQVLWADGEPLMINGPTGAGKTTLAQQLVLARIGLRDELLGFPVVDDGERVLYLACDRPKQVARSFRRMVGDDDRDVLDERLAVWAGPLPGDVVKRPDLLVALADEHGAKTVVVDSLKDIIPKLSDDESGARANQAFQLCVSAGVEVVVTHHQRKATGENKRPSTLADVYGSTWLTAGMGSVLLLWGEAGDPVVELTHLKPVAEPVGPLTLLHDHHIGSTTVQSGVDLLGMIRTSNGLNADAAARALFRTDTPKPNEVEKARRRLERLVREGAVHAEPGGRSELDGRQLPTRYYLVERRP